MKYDRIIRNKLRILLTKKEVIMNHQRYNDRSEYNSSGGLTAPHTLNILLRTLLLVVLAAILLLLYPALVGHAQTWKATADVNVRNRASMDSSVITSLKKGTKVKQTGTDGHWIAIEADGQTGYVYYKYLKKVADTKWWVKADAVNLRQKPNIESHRLDLLLQGQKVLLLSPGKEWSKVKTSKGKTGFVCNQYMSNKPVKAASQDEDREKKEKKKPSFVPDANTGKGLRYASSHASKIQEYRKAAIRCAKTHLGEKYSQKKRNKKGYHDCSSLVRDVFKKVSGEYIGGDTTSQAAIMNEYIYPISSVYDVKPGDLVYHLSSDNHTGIYMGEGMVLHASQGKGKVVISSFPEDGSFWEYGCNASLYCIMAN